MSGPAALLCDLGGVLVHDNLPQVTAEWAPRLGVSERAFVTALFAGNDETVLIGLVTEDEWWETVRGRLATDRETITAVRHDLFGAPEWDRTLAAELAGLRGRVRTAFVSNAWPSTRANLAELLPAAEVAVLSAEVGFAKPDRRIYTHALGLLGAAAPDALFIDDAPANVAAARDLGLRTHRHTGSETTLAAIRAFVRSVS